MTGVAGGVGGEGWGVIPNAVWPRTPHALRRHSATPSTCYLPSELPRLARSRGGAGTGGSGVGAGVATGGRRPPPRRASERCAQLAGPSRLPPPRLPSRRAWLAGGSLAVCVCVGRGDATKDESGGTAMRSHPWVRPFQTAPVQYVESASGPPVLCAKGPCSAPPPPLPSHPAAACPIKPTPLLVRMMG